MKEKVEVISRIIKKVSNGFNIRDGKMAFKVRRTIGGPIKSEETDPWILFDEMKHDEPSVYMDGFPSHGHRGINTLTYMINGIMEHCDSKGHSGIIKSPGVQFMTAGRGLIHSEMPKPCDIKNDSLIHGFQFWLNLPSKLKMIDPSYQNITSDQIPQLLIKDGGGGSDNSKISIIAGDYNGVKGPINNDYAQPLLLDIELNSSNTDLTIDIPDYNHNSFVYVFKGDGFFGPKDNLKQINQSQLGIFESQKDNISISTTNTPSKVEIKSGDNGIRFLLLSGKPLNEPIVMKGPFVMNTKEEIEQAYKDYGNGILDK